MVVAKLELCMKTIQSGTFSLRHNMDVSIATSQPEFLPAEVGKLWKALNAKQKHISTV